MTMLNKKHSEKTKKIMSEKSKGNKAFIGKKHTDEWKQKMSGPRLKRRGISAWNKGLGKFKDKKEKELHFNLKKYGISIDKYNELLKIQNYVCAICYKAETKYHQNGTICKLAVDHSHSTGQIRGLLCSKCNLGIGYLNDNPYLCQNAAKYLLTNSN